jgi:oligoendopeptidase F
MIYSYCGFNIISILIPHNIRRYIWGGDYMTKNSSKLPKRSEIPDSYKWNLKDFYAADSDFEKAFSEIKVRAHEFQKHANTLSQSSEALLACLNDYMDIQRSFEKAYVYAQMASHQDTTDSLYQSMANRTESLSVELSSASSFLIPAILAIPGEKLQSFLNENENLRFYDKLLDEIVRMKPHVLSPQEEQLLAMSGELSQAPASIFNMLNNADIKFPSIKDEKGNLVELTKGRYVSFMESSDRKVRKEVFDALYSSYISQKNTLAATLSAQVKANIFSAKARKYDSAREAALFPDDVPVSVYDNLIKAVGDNMGLMYRYIALRKKMLGVDELHMYDVYAPIVKDVKMEFPYEEAVKTVLKALTPLGEQYVQDLKKGFESGWIDAYENEGKRSGAYSWGHYDVHPYVLLNHNDTLDSVFTIAHEMGHSLHSLYSWKNQPYAYSNYKIFVAEVASTFNEALLTDYLLNTIDDKSKRLYILNHYFESVKGTVFRQTMFAEFEKIVHQRAEEGEALTSELLCSIYHDLNVKYFGPEMVVDSNIDMEWARIPHFYTSFYVYKYATGFSAATALSQKVLEGKPGALERYLDFLKSGGSDYPINELKAAGVDMTSPEPVISCLKVFEKYLDEFESLLTE